jgi:2-oxoglutarate dehydrogenase E1 component
VKGPSWARKDWPQPESGDLVSAFDGNGPPFPRPSPPRVVQSPKPEKAPGLSAEDVRKATMDSVRALMMIRAYRMRGHLAADLDPLKLKEGETHPELDPASYGFTEADMDRPIFLDKVLGLEHATVRQIVDILKRTYCGTLGVEFMHISDPEQKAGSRSGSKARQVDQLHAAKARRRSSTS